MGENNYILPKKPKIKEKVKAPDQRRFSVIPLRVIHLNMTNASYKVLVVLSSYCNKGGFSHVSLKRIGNDIGVSIQAVHRQIKRLIKLGIVKKVSGHYPMIKGATRRIIYNDNISDNDASKIANAPIEPYNNQDINNLLKARKVKRIIAKEDTVKRSKVKESIQTDKDVVTSLFMSVSKESELLALEKLIESGEPPLSIKAHINKGLSVLDYNS